MANSNWASEAFGDKPVPKNPRVLLCAETGKAPIYGTCIDLDAPETWHHSVWTAFERAHSDRITANLAHNEVRRVGQAGARIVCQNEIGS